MTTTYSGTLNQGDLIAIASDSYLQIGFYIGRGKNGTVQYYTIEQLSWWFDRNKGVPPTSIKKPSVSYVNSPSIYRFIKLHESSISTPEKKEQYKKSIELLKILNILP